MGVGGAYGEGAQPLWPGTFLPTFAFQTKCFKICLLSLASPLRDLNKDPLWHLM